MVDPQRGQVAQEPPQVVPQDEQVEQPQAALLPVQPLWQVAVAVEPDAAAALTPADCGKRGREKNSSHTFSANSSLGGIWQKP